MTTVEHDDIVGRGIWTKKPSGDSEPGHLGDPAISTRQVGVQSGPGKCRSIASHRTWIKNITGTWPLRRELRRRSH